MRKVLRSFLFISFVSVVVLSCEKESEPFPPVTSQEKPSISLPDGNNLVIAALDISTTVVTAEILEIRRDATSPADLNRVQTVKIAKSNSVLSDLSGAAVTELPRDLYQSHPDNPFDGQFWTITFQPGEFVKHLKINLKTIDLTSLGRVGLGFQLASADNGAVLSEQNQVAVELGSKNKYDGIYEITGAALREADPLLTGPFGPYERTLVTSGANSVQWVGQVLWANGANSALPPGYEPEITVDPVTNLITLLRSPNGAISMTNPVVRTDILNGTQQRYDPASKTLYFEFTYTTPTNRLFSFKAKYLRPR
ncbi:MAG TPA: hypothetical protein VHQ93_03960 [Chitinophagaceae bacterium]|jgi:hypothetical protein|nr:hypothetical protein [Chitinophagaceae bacterium]